MSTDMKMRCTHCRSIHTGKAEFFYELTTCPTCYKSANFERLDSPRPEVISTHTHSPTAKLSLPTLIGWATAAAMLMWVVALKFDHADMATAQAAAEAQWQTEREALKAAITQSQTAASEANQATATLAKQIEKQSSAAKDNTLAWQNQVIALQDKINDLQAQQQKKTRSDLAASKLFSELKAELTTLKSTQDKHLAQIENYEDALKVRDERIENLSTLLNEKPKRTTPVIQHFGPKREVVQPTTTFKTLHYTKPRTVILTNDCVVPASSSHTIISTGGGLSVNYDRKTKNSQLGISWGN